jgi:hypothetical protein
MALDNNISIEFTAADIAAIDNALTAIEAALAGKVVNLTPLDRKTFGKINNKRENWVTKVRNYITQLPTIKPSYLDLPEHDKDIDARNVIMPRLNRIVAINRSMEDTAMLISSDLYHNSLGVYGNVKEMSKRNVPGITPIYHDLKDQFPGGKGHKTGNVPPPAPTPTA